MGKNKSWLQVFFLLSVIFLIKSYVMCSSIYDSIKLEDLDFTYFHRVSRKQDRSVFKDKRTGWYYKIWGENYAPTHHFLSALKLGFYENFAPLVALIFDQEDRCRGYVTYECIPFYKAPVLIKGGTFAPYAQQGKAYRTFFDNLIARIKKTGFVYTDFIPSNVVYFQGHYVIIDLESVCPLGQLSPYFFMQNKLSLREYQETIKKIIGEKEY